jgi:hypothetical protein
MFKSFLTVFFAATAVSLVACASGASNDSSGTPGDEEDINSIKTCGGIAGLQCAAGEDCVIADKDLNVPDASGNCRKPTGRGGDSQLCGGIAGIPCGPGLECVLPAHPVPDVPGKCQKASGSTDNTACGGFAGIACPSGFECVLPKVNGSPVPDMAGHCTKQTSTDGQACGGIAGLPCPKGLSCVSISKILDAPGRCQK